MKLSRASTSFAPVDFPFLSPSSPFDPPCSASFWAALFSTRDCTSSRALSMTARAFLAAAAAALAAACNSVSLSLPAGLVPFLALPAAGSLPSFRLRQPPPLTALHS